MTEESEEEVEEVPAPSGSRGRKARSVKAPAKKRSKTEEQEEEFEFSETENSQKRYLKSIAKSTGKGTKKVGKAQQKKQFRTITKNFAPDDAPDQNHKYYYRAFIGGGFNVTFAKWLKNNQKYIQIRKGFGNSMGANVPVAQYTHLKNAINDIEKLCPKELFKQKMSDNSE